MRSLPFGKNKGKALERCEEGYVKWLATHKAVLKPCNQPYADDAKQLLEKKEEKSMHVGKFQIEDVIEEGKSLELKQGFLSFCVNVDPSLVGVAASLEIGQKVEIGLSDAKELKDQVVVQIKIA
jgi:hypothetical protein